MIRLQCYDLLVRHLHFSALSLTGAVVVFVSFVLLNILEIHENRTEKAAIEQRAADLHRSESNRSESSTRQIYVDRPSQASRWTCLWRFDWLFLTGGCLRFRLHSAGSEPA